MKFDIILLIQIVVLLIFKFVIKPDIYYFDNSKLLKQDTSLIRVGFVGLSILMGLFVYYWGYRNNIVFSNNSNLLIQIICLTAIIALNEILFRHYIFNLSMKYLKDENYSGNIQAVLYGLFMCLVFVNITNVSDFRAITFFGTSLIYGQGLTIIYYRNFKSNYWIPMCLSIVSFLCVTLYMI